MSWTSLKDIADKSLSQRGIKNRIQESWLIQIANEQLFDYFGEVGRDKVRAIYFKEGILTLAVLSDDLLFDIERAKFELIEILNNKLDSDLVNDLRFLT